MLATAVRKIDRNASVSIAPLDRQQEGRAEVDGLGVARFRQLVGETEGDLLPDRLRSQQAAGPLAEGVAVVERGAGPARDHPHGQQHGGDDDEDPCGQAPGPSVGELLGGGQCDPRAAGVGARSANPPIGVMLERYRRAGVGQGRTGATGKAPECARPDR